MSACGTYCTRIARHASEMCEQRYSPAELALAERIEVLESEIAAFDARVVNTDSVVTEQRKAIAALRAERDMWHGDAAKWASLADHYMAERDEMRKALEEIVRECEYCAPPARKALTTNRSADD